MSHLALKSRRHTHLTKSDVWLPDFRCIVLIVSIDEFQIELIDIGLDRDGLSNFEPIIFHLLMNDAFPSAKGRVLVILTDIDPPLLLGINHHQHSLLAYYTRSFSMLVSVFKPISDVVLI